MNFREVIGVAWKNIASNKSRSLLTMLGVIIGVSAVIVMLAVGAGTEANIAEAIQGLGTNLVFINGAFTRGGPEQQQNSRGGLVYSDVAAIRDKISGVAGVSVEQRADVALKYGSVTLEGVPLVGTTPDFTTVRGLSVATGRFIKETEVDRVQKVVILGASVAEELFGTADPIGQSITAANTKLTVVGVLAKRGLVSGTNFDEMVYVPISVVFQKFTPSMMARVMGDRVRSIYVSVDENANMDNVVEQIKLLLAKRHGVTLDSLDFNVQTQSDIIQTRVSTTASFRNLLAWVAGVSLIVGGIGIMNIMLVSVTERTREIGLREAVGATPGDIKIQFLTEALMLSLVGGIIGVFAGVGSSWLFGKLGTMRTVVVPYSIFLSFGSAALIGILFGYLPAQTAARLDPIEALRHD